jgi:hypothetical protein
VAGRYVSVTLVPLPERGYALFAEPTGVSGWAVRVSHHSCHYQKGETKLWWSKNSS